ncbi:MAG: Holliday junction resolvase RuvX [Nocardioidaceae bacterium]
MTEPRPASDEASEPVAPSTTAAVRPGVRLGIDVGAVRIGVARTDRQALLATPVETVRRGEGDVARILDLVQELEAVEIVVGFPRSYVGPGRAGRGESDRVRRDAPGRCPVTADPGLDSPRG